jgi:hypothetical protein
MKDDRVDPTRPTNEPMIKNANPVPIAPATRIARNESQANVDCTNPVTPRGAVQIVA